jgi:hypothetical protein
MVEYLKEIPELRVIILDNASTYPELLNWYDTNPCEIERLTFNFGNFTLWSSPDAVEGHTKPNFFEKYDCVESQYIVSDSDLFLNDIPRETLLSTLEEGLRRHPWAVKCGLGLRIDDLPNTELAIEAKKWEGNNWTLIDDMYIKAAVDTTFCLCTGIGEQNDFNRCLRTNFPYVARHAGWYYGPHNPPPEDEMWYLRNVSRSHNHYSSRLFNIMEGRSMNHGL